MNLGQQSGPGPIQRSRHKAKPNSHPCTQWLRVHHSKAVTGFPKPPALHCPHLKLSVLNAVGILLLGWVGFPPRFLWLLLGQMEGAAAESCWLSVCTVQPVSNFLACSPGMAKSNTLAWKRTGNVSVLMRSSQKPGRCRMTSSLPSNF